MSSFVAFLLDHLPPPPARVLEVGCGRRGGVTPQLVEFGYDALGIDEEAPPGDRFRPIRLQELEEPAQFDAVVAERVFHHVHPLGEALDKVARLAPLFVLDEFAWERIDEPARDWYEGQYRALAAAGREPPGPPNLADWRTRWDGLHPSDVLRGELALRFDERLYEDRAYLYRWLDGPATEPLEQALIDGGAIRPIGFRWIGVSRYKAARARTERP